MKSFDQSPFKDVTNEFPPYYTLSRRAENNHPLLFPEDEEFTHRLIFYYDYTKKNAICGPDGMGFKMCFPSESTLKVTVTGEDILKVGGRAAGALFSIIVPVPALVVVAVDVAKSIANEGKNEEELRATIKKEREEKTTNW